MDKLTVRSIAKAINESVPEATQEEWDNSGVQIHIDDREVNKILVCLEVTEEVADEAMVSGVEMIVCHHPLFFGDIRNIDGATSYGRTLIKLIRAGISVYASHTPFDRIEGEATIFLPIYWDFQRSLRLAKPTVWICAEPALSPQWAR